MAPRSTTGRGRKGPGSGRVLNCLPSPDPERDYGFQAAVAAGGPDRRVRLPERVDLRASWWRIDDQGSTGSCVGQATAGGVLRRQFQTAGRLRMTERLSVRYLWMAAKETDEFTRSATTFIETDGTSIKAALEVARKSGVVLESVLPFSGGLFPGEADEFYSLASNRKIASYHRIGVGDWKRWLATVGPIVTRLDVDQTWDDVTATGFLDEYRPPGRGGHAVCVVGYDSDRYTIRNSWGVGWGAKGFAFASATYAEVAFTESYGVRVV
jgi:hypothetical protein